MNGVTANSGRHVVQSSPFPKSLLLEETRETKSRSAATSAHVGSVPGLLQQRGFHVLARLGNPYVFHFVSCSFPCTPQTLPLHISEIRYAQLQNTFGHLRSLIVTRRASLRLIPITVAFPINGSGLFYVKKKRAQNDDKQQRTGN